MSKKQEIEDIVADIRNKLQPISTYFQIKGRVPNPNTETHLRESEERALKNLPIIIEQLKNLTKI